ncbi:MAG TPA: DUF2231 domain-containing protein [Phycisphaerales bacterium]|nr:DUF2231 domain-containing protein [Phycisphaerales bacterium]
MQARARLFGHPIHQMLIVLPLGLFAASVLFDVLNMVTSSNRWADVAFWCVAIGVGGGLLAAVFGAVDWIGIPAGTRAKTVGAVHGIGNVIVVGLFAVSGLLRALAMPDVSVPAVALSFVGAGLSLFTGWLGGELVNRLGVGVYEGANVNAPSSLTKRSAGGEITGDGRASVPGRTVRDGEDATISAAREDASGRSVTELRGRSSLRDVPPPLP